jgi:Family of unknown function (DUF6247)
MPLTVSNGPFAGASPAELREAILPESREEFDAQYNAALETARTALRLDGLDDFLEGWRRMAWLQSDPDRYRRMMATAAYVGEHGEPPPGTRTCSEEEMMELIQSRLAVAR